MQINHALCIRSKYGTTVFSKQIPNKRSIFVSKKNNCLEYFHSPFAMWRLLEEKCFIVKKVYQDNYCEDRYFKSIHSKVGENLLNLIKIVETQKMFTIQELPYLSGQIMKWTWAKKPNITFKPLADNKIMVRFGSDKCYAPIPKTVHPAMPDVYV